MEKACNNCGTLVTTAYCGNCGQKASVGRLTMHALLHEWWHGFTHVDKGVFLLIRDLAIRPRHTYLSYFSGARKRYFSPVVFFLVSFGLFIYADQKVFDYEDYIYRAYNASYYNEYGRFFHLQLKYIALTWLPFQALFSWLFFFRQRNLAECLTFWLYCTGFINVLLIVATPLRLWLIHDKKMVDYVLELIGMVIMLIHAWRLFGTSLTNKLLVLAMMFILLVINVYISYYYIIHAHIPVHYPGLKEAVIEVFRP